MKVIILESGKVIFLWNLKVGFFKFVFCCLLLERSYCGLISDGIILSLKLILFINGAKSVSPAAKEPKHHAWIAPSA